MPTSVVRRCSRHAIAAALAVVALTACGASEEPRQLTAAIETPTLEASTPSAPAAAGIGLDPATAAATLVQLVDPLDEPDYYCVDVPGFGSSLDLGAALTAHTCKPGANDEMFAVDQPEPGKLYMPAYDLCMEAGGTEAPAQLFLRVCYEGAPQQFDFDSGGTLALSGTGLCLAVSPEEGEPTGGPSHLRRDLLLVACEDTEPALKTWRFPGRSPR